LEALRDKAHLLGMNAPAKTEVTLPIGPNGESVIVYLPDNERDPDITVLGDAPHDDDQHPIDGPPPSD
jgi:hypothetical protein